MPVPETVQQLRAARALHKAWFVRAEALVNGLPVTQEQTPVRAMECEFGRWLKSAEGRLRDFSVLRDIKLTHDSLHQVYADIFNLLFPQPTGMGKLFGQSKKTKASNHLEAEILLTRLQGQYDTLTNLLAALEKDYLALKDRPKPPMEDLQIQSFRDVAKMMEELEKDVDAWLK
ncbi:MAG TPA: hypothetical protein EYG66_02530 [Mariprofundaceae bacterium]|nr:hypothetical protein [Mariprofundaceae bacterium]